MSELDLLPAAGVEEGVFSSPLSLVEKEDVVLPVSLQEIDPGPWPLRLN